MRRSSSGLGLGDNIHNHTDKWLQVCSSLRASAASCQASAGRLFVCPDPSLCGRVQVDEYYTGNTKPPMQYCEEIEPIKCHGQVVASYGGMLCPSAEWDALCVNALLLPLCVRARECKTAW